MKSAAQTMSTTPTAISAPHSSRRSKPFFLRAIEDDHAFDPGCRGWP
jgi:hypothetical protein